MKADHRESETFFVDEKARRERKQNKAISLS